MRGEPPTIYDQPDYYVLCGDCAHVQTVPPWHEMRSCENCRSTNVSRYDDLDDAEQASQEMLDDVSDEMAADNAEFGG